MIPRPRGVGGAGGGIVLRKRLAGIYDNPGVRNRPVTVPRLTIVRPGPILIDPHEHRPDETETTWNETRRFCQLDFPTCPTPRNVNDARRTMR